MQIHQIQHDAATPGSSVGAPRARRMLNPALAAALLANVLWSTAFFTSQYTLKAWPPLTAGAMRLGLATVFLLLGMKLSRQPIDVPQSRKAWGLIFLVSTSGFGILYPLQLSGLTRIASGLSAAIMLTAPLFVVVFGSLLLRESLDRRKGLALLLGLAGGIILVGDAGSALTGGERFVAGCLLTFAASACFALSAVLSRITSRYIATGSITFWATLLAFVTLAAMALAVDRPAPHATFVTPSLSAWMALVYLAMVCSALCYFAWYYALARTSAKDIAPTMYIKTPAAVLLGTVAGREPLTVAIVVGTVVVMFAVWLSQSTAGRR